MKRSIEVEIEDQYDSNITSMANYLMLLARGTTTTTTTTTIQSYDVLNSVSRVFECKTCNRQFSSFQALGGHRASHKKPRFANGDMSSGHDHDENMVTPSKPKSHKCSICGLEFALGQALGGHMRRHRTAAEESLPAVDSCSPPVVIKKVNSRRIFCLDLNLTPLENDFRFRVDDEKLTPVTVDFFL